MNYSENAGRQYHIQIGEGDIGKYVILHLQIASDFKYLNFLNSLEFQLLLVDDNF